MKYALYEDPNTHRFALLPLPVRFADDDEVPVAATARWFDSREEAVAALPDLLNGDDDAEIESADRPH